MPLTDLWLHSRDQLEDKQSSRLLPLPAQGSSGMGMLGRQSFETFSLMCRQTCSDGMPTNACKRGSVGRALPCRTLLMR